MKNTTEKVFKIGVMGFAIGNLVLVGILTFIILSKQLPTLQQPPPVSPIAPLTPPRQARNILQPIPIPRFKFIGEGRVRKTITLLQSPNGLPVTSPSLNRAPLVVQKWTRVKIIDIKDDWIFIATPGYSVGWMRLCDLARTS